ncbi:MAG TPA: zinc ribbon domain-containing protein [Verrucomicrobiae bacterium]|nr:zinc ribbon domain-containing protein [Verrucomicrobiae bacterium]
MPEFCTCGAQLPPDALFCHKCGKPQREIAAVEPEPVPVVAAPPVPVEAPKVDPATVNFHNREALKVALLAAALATFLVFVPYVNWVVGGYFSVFFYRRRTRRTVNIAAGVRIGWLTGLIAFVMAAAIFTTGILIMRSPGVMDAMKAAAQDNEWIRQSLSTAQQTLAVTQSASTVIASLVGGFIFVTFLCMTGGLLGAVLTGAVSPPPRGGNTV